MALFNLVLIIKRGDSLNEYLETSPPINKKGVDY